MNKTRFFIYLLVTIFLFGFSNSLIAETVDPPHTKQWKLMRGGLLYDNWAAVMFTTLPKTTHPAYPSNGKKEGGSTWRCKECHGWDYRGKDGAYQKGSHYSGVKGIRNMVGAPTKSIKEIIRNDVHKYNESMIPEVELNNLAEFISHGQVDMTKFIDDASKEVKGDSEQGIVYYQTICANCHGLDGKSINFKPSKPDHPEYIGTVANKNPWEALHKLRHGQPGVPMTSLLALDIQSQIDILAYTKTLPMK